MYMLISGPQFLDAEKILLRIHNTALVFKLWISASQVFD